jgi:hypothetical protein
MSKTKLIVKKNNIIDKPGTHQLWYKARIIKAHLLSFFLSKIIELKEIKPIKTQALLDEAKERMKENRT